MILSDEQKSVLMFLLLGEARRQDSAGNPEYLAALVVGDDKARDAEFVALAAKASVTVKTQLGDLAARLDAEQKRLQELDATLDSLLITV